MPIQAGHPPGKMKVPPAFRYPLWFLAAAACAVRIASAEPQDVSLEVNPASVEIPYEGEATVLIVLQNTGAGSLDAASLSAFSNPALQVKLEPAESRPIAGRGSLVWTARVSAGGLSAVAGSVYFRVDYKRPAKEGETAATVPVTVVKPLAVTSQAPLALTEVIEVRAETTIESVNSKRPGFLYLTLKSKANIPVTAESITVKYPGWMGVYAWESGMKAPSNHPGPATVEAIPYPLSIAPYESRTIGFQVTANPEVKPGKQLIVFEVPLQWEKGGRHQKAVAIATQQIDVGVFGETAILAAIGIPTFLFLPGFLMLATIVLLWKIGKTTTEKEAIPFKASTPDFYLVAITLSIAAFAAYPWLTKHLTGVRRDFTEAYGLQDVVWVWCGSVIAGLLGFGLWRLIAFICNRIGRWYRNKSRFAASDNEKAFIEKLKRRGLGVRFWPVSIGTGADAGSAYFIEADPVEQGKCWVASKVAMEWQLGSEKDQEAVTGPLNDTNASASKVLSALLDALKRKTVSLQWTKGSGTITGLQKLDAVTVKRSGQPQVVILENA